MKPHFSGPFPHHAFTYAVPTHCLHPSRPYNPYDIVSIPHVCIYLMIYRYQCDHSRKLDSIAGRAVWLLRRRTPTKRSQVRFLHSQHERVHLPCQRRRISGYVSTVNRLETTEGAIRSNSKAVDLCLVRCILIRECVVVV